MPRIRSIKPEFWTSEQVVECSLSARLLFIGLWNFCDDCGRHPNSAKQIKAEVFPADEISLDSIRGWIDELSKNGLLLTYTIDGKDLLQVTGWHHQRIDKPRPERYPPPTGMISDHSKNAPRSFPPDTIGNDTKGEDARATSPTDRGKINERSANFRRRIVEAYEPTGQIPDTSIAEVWLLQGRDPDICVAVISERFSRDKAFKPLTYFEKPIAEAQAKRVTFQPKAILEPETQERVWKSLLDGEQRTGQWPSKQVQKSEIPAEFIAKWQQDRDLEIPTDLRRTA